LRNNASHHEEKVSDKTAIVIDDSETMRRLLKFILQSMGINVIADGINGLQAIELVKENVPDLLCMDIDMPIMDGLAALDKIKSIYPEVAVIMISAHNDKKTVVNAIQKGASGYILKPYDPDLIEIEVNRVLKDFSAGDLDSVFDPA
jgi:two-component system chemotaxis response regulator CheY